MIYLDLTDILMIDILATLYWDTPLPITALVKF